MPYCHIIPLYAPYNYQHNYLLPFFGNNKFIESYLHKYPNCVIKGDFIHDKEVARTTKLTDSPFVYEVHFDDNLSLWK